MLKEEVKKIEIRENDNVPFWDMGVLMFCKADGLFYEISFGDGTDNEPVGDCDDYAYLQTFGFNGCEFEERDGGNFWFHRKDYTGYINDEKFIRDCLEFMDCPDVENCIYLKRA